MLDICRNYDILRGVRKLCNYTGDCISRAWTARKFKIAVRDGGVTQQKIAGRMGISRSRLNELLNGSPRYRWSEDIARRIMRALKRK